MTKTNRIPVTQEMIDDREVFIEFVKDEVSRALQESFIQFDKEQQDKFLNGEGKEKPVGIIKGT